MTTSGRGPNRISTLTMFKIVKQTHKNWTRKECITYQDLLSVVADRNLLLGLIVNIIGLSIMATCNRVGV